MFDNNPDNGRDVREDRWGEWGDPHLIKFIGFDVPESQKRAVRQAAGTTAGYAGSHSVQRKSRELVASVNIRSARTAPRIQRQRIPTIRWVRTLLFLINRLVRCFPLVNIAMKRDWMMSGRKLIAERKIQNSSKTEKKTKASENLISQITS